MEDKVLTRPLLIPNAPGSLPFKRGPVRFAVGSPNGLTSNAWRVWTTRHGDVYIACRDSFKEAKVSLHASGRWRMGFTVHAVAKNPALLPSETNRAWEVWDRPPSSLPNTVIAFKLLFPTSELAVRPEQRVQKEWKDVVYIEAAPSGKVAVVTLFLTAGDIALSHESEPSCCLASISIDTGRYGKLVAHLDPEGDLPQLIDRSVAAARAESARIVLPREAYGYFFGHNDAGWRFLFGARMSRPADIATPAS
jgi:hypothetical protein